MALDTVGGAPVTLPNQRALYYGGAWHEALDGSREEMRSPSTAETLGHVSWARAADVERAVAAAEAGFQDWRRVKPLERARILQEAAAIIRACGRELALIDIPSPRSARPAWTTSPASCSSWRAPPFRWARAC